MCKYCERDKGNRPLPVGITIEKLLSEASKIPADCEYLPGLTFTQISTDRLAVLEKDHATMERLRQWKPFYILYGSIDITNRVLTEPTDPRLGILEVSPNNAPITNCFQQRMGTKDYHARRYSGGDEMNILERQAEFVYNGARLAAIAANAPIIPVVWLEREQPFKDQFVKVIERQCGEQRSNSPEELHGSWMQAYFAMGWVYGEKYDREKKTHPDLVSYSQLGQLERDKDAVFVALCEIARQWIY